MNVQEVLTLLERDRLFHMDMTESLRRGNGTVVYAEEDCVLLETRSDIALLTAETKDSGIRALQTLSAIPNCVVAHGESARDAVFSVITDFLHAEGCYQASYLKPEPPEVLDVCRIVPYPIGEARFVVDHYAMAHDLAHVEASIRNGDLFAAYIGEKLVGFIGYHNDGSMGKLEVLPEYRRQRIGTALEQYLIGDSMRRGWTPYCQIYTWNDASMRLQGRLGLEISPKILYWMFGDK